MDVGFFVKAADCFGDSTYGDKTVYISLAPAQMVLLHQMDSPSVTYAHNFLVDAIHGTTRLACNELRRSEGPAC